MLHCPLPMTDPPFTHVLRPAAAVTDAHCLQCPSPMTDPPFTRVLHPDAGGLPYHPRSDELKTVVHWGQRKLLLSEIEFLTICQRDHDTASQPHTLVYAGAAPGTHVAALSAMFPATKFVLVDPAPFSVSASDSIEIVRDLFTDDLARQLASRPCVLFVSDIRTADPTLHSLEESDRRIRQDMLAQWRWHALLGSRRSMLKFRLPWDKESSAYLDGEVRLPVFGPPTTTECRLVTRADDPAATREYDHERYESQMFFHNTVMRPARYSHPVRSGGLDGCYDCRAEVEILRSYLESSPHWPRKHEDLDADVAALSQWISRALSRHRTLADPSPDKQARLAGIKRRQYVDGAPAYEFAKRHFMTTASTAAQVPQAAAAAAPVSQPGSSPA